MRCFYFSDMVGYKSSLIKEVVVLRKHPIGISLKYTLGDDIEYNLCSKSNYTFTINLLLITNIKSLACLIFKKTFKLMNEIRPIKYNPADSDNIKEYILTTGEDIGLDIPSEESDLLLNSLQNKIDMADHSQPLFNYDYDNINLVKSLNKGIKCLGGQ